jgi:hypothetical protein
VRPEGFGKLKKCCDLVGNRTRDFPACNLLPQTTSPPSGPGISGNLLLAVQCSVGTAWRFRKQPIAIRVSHNETLQK